MSKARICFKVWGLAADVQGNPTYAGCEISFGETEKQVDYQEAVKGLDKAELLELCCLGGIAKPEDLMFITPEEYDREYGCNDA